MLEGLSDGPADNSETKLAVEVVEDVGRLQELHCVVSSSTSKSAS